MRTDPTVRANSGTGSKYDVPASWTEQTPRYRHLGNFAVSPSHSVGLECHHCMVFWGGCAAECCCPECGAPKNYWDGGECWCDPCVAARHPKIDPPLTWDEIIVGGIGIALMGLAVVYIVYKLAVWGL